VPDLTKYGTFGMAPDVPLSIRGFASAPLTTSANHLIGTISILDVQPLSLNAQQLDLFVAMSRRVADELARRYLPDQDDDARRHLRSEEKWAALERLALTDSLTGLSNRWAGERALEREVARSRRTASPLSLAMLDLDHFKQINDKYGHSTGDRVLRDVAHVLTAAFRASDLAIRWGGDEFLVLLPDVSVDGAVVFAERARTQMSAVAMPESRSLTMSAGVVQVMPGEDPQVSIARADHCLYEAKRAGRNRVEPQRSAGLEHFNEEAHC
jgi:diguanylate cyclase (GGDEF)-like protein